LPDLQEGRYKTGITTVVLTRAEASVIIKVVPAELEIRRFAA
jgi:hypothetical protein